MKDRIEAITLPVADVDGNSWLLQEVPSRA